MPQSTPTIASGQSGASYRGQDNAGKEAICSTHKGGTAPSYAVAGMIWCDDSASPILNYKAYDGSDWISIGTANATTNVWSPANSALFDGSRNYAADAGGTDAYAITLSPARTTYATGEANFFKANTRNTGAATLALNGMAAKSLKRPNGNDPISGDIPAASMILSAYDGTNMQFIPAMEAFYPNAQTGTTYTVLTGDRNKLVTFTNASAIAVTLPQAGAGFENGWMAAFQNRGAGLVTITPTTSTIDGAASITLSQNQGVMIFSDGTDYFTMRGRGIASRADAFAGSVLQVVQTVKTDTFTTASTSFVDVTGMSVTITPTDTNNQVLIRAVLQYSTNATPILQVRLLRGATEIASGTAAGSRTTAAAAGYTGGAAIMQSLEIEFLDSPASTSAQTYKIQFRASTANNVHLNRTDSDTDNAGSARTASTITAMEVAV